MLRVVVILSLPSFLKRYSYSSNPEKDVKSYPAVTSASDEISTIKASLRGVISMFFPCYFLLACMDWDGNFARLSKYHRFGEEPIRKRWNEFLDEEVKTMANKEILDKLSIYIPQKKMEEKPVERLIRLSEKRDRSINYLVVDAILQYLNREEKKG